MSKLSKTRIIVLIGVLSAFSFILYALEIPVGFLFPAAPFLKIDFSDVPAVIGGIAAGPIVGVAVEYIKNLLHFIFISKEPMASGELGNFFAGIGYVVPVAIMMRKNKYPAIVSYAAGAVIGTAFASITNYFIALPLYGITQASVKLNLLLVAFTPFNLLKWALISVVTALLYPRLKSAIGGFLEK